MKSGQIGPINQPVFHKVSSPKGKKAEEVMLNLTDSVDLKSDKGELDVKKAVSQLFDAEISKGVKVEWSPVCVLDNSPSPVISKDGVIFMGSSENGFSAVEADTGKVLWDRDMGTYVPYSPALSHDEKTVLVPDNNSTVSALDAKTGRKLWSAAPGGTTFRVSTPIISKDDKTAFIGGEAKEFYALDMATGKVKWEAPVKIKDGGVPAFSPDEKTIYVGDDSWNLKAIDAETGDVKWSYELDKNEWTRCSPAVGPDGTIYMGGSKGRIFAIDPKKGKKKWRTRELEQNSLLEFTFLPSPDGKRVYAVTPFLDYGETKGKIIALDPKRGKVKWEKDFDKKLHKPCMSADGQTIYAGSDDGSLYSINAPQGEINWKTPLDKYVYSPALNADESRIYVTTGYYIKKQGHESTLAAVDAKTGQPVKGFKTEGSMRTNVPGNDGQVRMNSDLDYFGKTRKEQAQERPEGETPAKDLSIKKEEKKVIIGGVELNVRDK